ncbi:unnamed protein product [Brassica napus]|uniref:(rape) hypothetical protein n=1 Tax=Brassica napus TaxID=3708 RepID=A0A816UML0_BRANA|nr:unnamed protein product [Brassica napus]
MANSFTLFADLKACRCSNTSESTVIQGSVSVNRVSKFSQQTTSWDVNVPVSMFDYLALAFHKKIDSYGKEPKIVLATNINPKIVGGRLVLKATSGTHIYFDSETAAGKEEFEPIADDRRWNRPDSIFIKAAQVKGLQFTSKHQTFTISGVFPSRELAPVPSFVVNVPEASQPEVVATGSDVKVDNTCSVTEAPSTSDGSLAGRTESASEQVALEENAPKKPRLE